MSTENEARRLAVNFGMDDLAQVKKAYDEAEAELAETKAVLSDAEANRDAWKTNAGGWQSRALAAEANLVSMQRENEEIHRSYEAKLRKAERERDEERWRAEDLHVELKWRLEMLEAAEAKLREYEKALRKIRDEDWCAFQTYKTANDALTRSNDEEARNA